MPDTSQLTENKALVERLFEELDNQNGDIFDELVAEDLTTDVYRSGIDEAVGDRAGMKSLWEEYWTAFPDLTTDSQTLIAEGDRVAYFKTDRGTHEGVFRGIEPTETEIEFEYSGYFIIDEGRIVESYAHGDMLSLFDQLGVEVPLPV